MKGDDLRGELTGLSLYDVLQMIHLSHKTCCVNVEKDGELGRIYVQSGQVVHAEKGALEGKQAFQDMLNQEGQNIYMDRYKEPSRHTIQTSLDTLILQCVVRIEEDQETVKKLLEGDKPLFKEELLYAQGSAGTETPATDREKTDMPAKTNGMSEKGNDSPTKEGPSSKGKGKRIDELMDQLNGLTAKDGTQNQDQKTKEERDMPEKRSDKIESALSKLLAESSDIEGAALVGTDGLVIAAKLPVAKFDDAVLGATAAAMLGLSKKSLGTLAKGDFAQTLVQGSGGNLVITSVDPRTVLVCLTPKDVNLGMVFLEARNLAEKMAGILA